MKLTFILFLLCIGLSTISAQELKVKKINSKYSSEIFQVDKKTKERVGRYVKLENSSGDTLVIGYFTNDIKSGLWNYYSKGNIPWMSYDYDKKSLVRIPEEISKLDTFVIRRGDAFAYEKVDQPPVYLGFEKEIRMTMARYFRVSPQLMESAFSGVEIASFIVDKNGQMSEFKIEQGQGKIEEASALEAFKAIQGEWLPARVNGEAVDSKILMIFEISPPETPETFESTLNVYAVKISYFGIKRTTTVRKVGGSPFSSRVGIPQQHTQSYGR